MEDNGVYYVVKNQEEYDWLMRYLRDEGCYWRYYHNDGVLPTEHDFFPDEDEWEEINAIDLHLFEVFRLGKNIEYGFEIVHSLEDRKDDNIDTSDLMKGG